MEEEGCQVIFHHLQTVFHFVVEEVFHVLHAKMTIEKLFLVDKMCHVRYSLVRHGSLEKKALLNIRITAAVLFVESLAAMLCYQLRRGFVDNALIVPPGHVGDILVSEDDFQQSAVVACGISLEVHANSVFPFGEGVLDNAISKLANEVVLDAPFLLHHLQQYEEGIVIDAVIHLMVFDCSQVERMRFGEILVDSELQHVEINRLDSLVRQSIVLCDVL